VVATSSDGHSGTPAWPTRKCSRRVPIGGRSVAQLSVVIPSPAADRAVIKDGTGVVVSSSDSRSGTPARIPPHYCSGRVPRGGRAVAQLAAAVVSPASNRAVIKDGTGVVATSSDSHSGTPAWPTRKCSGRVPRGGRSVAQLAVAVGAPASNRAVIKDGTGVVATSSDGHSGTPAWPTRKCSGRVPRGGRSVAQLSVVIPSPAADRAVVEDGAGMAAAISSDGHRGTPAWPTRKCSGRVSIGGRSVAQLAVGVVAPASNRAVIKDGTGVVATSSDSGILVYRAGLCSTI